MYPPAIEIKNATVKLDGYEALTNFSCTIGHRERWFVLGPNGAGKTTFVKLAALGRNRQSSRPEIR